MKRILRNETARPFSSPHAQHIVGSPLDYHRRLPGYRRTPLIDAKGLASQLGVGQVLVKDESNRFELPSFKILGASWGIYRALQEQFGEFDTWSSLEDLRDQLKDRLPLTLTAATEGNHGRAVARMAKLLGLDARIFVPLGTALSRIESIQSEGASCVMVDGNYDDAVRYSAEETDDRSLLVSDMSWPGYEDIPKWIIEGYSTIFFEIDDQLTEAGISQPNVILVQLGVGALGAAAAHHFRLTEVDTTLVGVEPENAACVFRSIEAGGLVTVPGPHESIMAGLNCGTPSLVAWPTVSETFNAFVLIDDERARQAGRMLQYEGIIAGETGAAGLGGLIELVHSGEATELDISPTSSVLLLSTEARQEPESSARRQGYSQKSRDSS